jgi:peptidoglycan/LPS O-acetylase OafA/YrhL
MTFPRQNNFDLLRLFAALQVLVYHLLSHFNLIETIPYLATVMNQFPGVPIFFFISGFLITASWNKSGTTLKTFFKNRILRIYPALWVCLLFTILLLLFFGEIEFSNPKFYLWIVGQMTFFQHYSPDIFDSWGAGNPNGSLWSIVVELQFYLILPFICLFLNRLGSLKKINLAIFGIFTTFYLLNHFIHATIVDPYSKYYLIDKPELLYFRIFSVSIIWNLYYFIIGLFFYYNFNFLKKIITQKFPIWLVIYIVYLYFLIPIHKELTSPDGDNLLSFIELILLALLTFSFAFSYTSLSEKVLKHNDISYGIYIYHMPVINTILAVNLKGVVFQLLISSIIVINLAILSWVFVEKKAMALKSAKT